MSWEVKLKSALEVFLVFLKLGLTSFGGPVAHLSYFHLEFVRNRKWVDEESYADLVALCQFLPGPASSQVGIALGLRRAGYLGAFLAWLGLTLPSAVLLILFGLSVSRENALGLGFLHGLKVVAVAVVAQAVWAMATKFCPDRERVSLALICAALSVFAPSAYLQLVLIVLGGFFGAIYLKKKSALLPPTPIRSRVSRSAGVFFLSLFSVFLIGLPVLARLSGVQFVKMFDSFFRAGSLVFGGGHVVLPLLRAEVVPAGWVSNEVFVAGYGAAQAIPGPLFAFSAFLGSVSVVPPNGWGGALLCLIAAFLPAFLLILGALPFWEWLRGYSRVRHAMQGINATIVGLLCGALYSPVWTTGILSGRDFALALFCFLLLAFWSVPSWAVVLLGALAGQLALS